MALPSELLHFAENFYRRFPEEFLALGAPGLEDIYDLRPNSTLTRKIQESPSEKTVEITIRRWQQPPPPAGYGRMPHSFGYPQASASSTAGQYGYNNYGIQSQPQYSSYGMPPPSYGMQSFGHSMGPPPAAVPAEPPRWESELTARLARLEGALSSLKPQIEVLLTAPPPSQQHFDHGRQAPLQASAIAGSSDDHTIHQNSKPPPSNSVSPRGGGSSTKMTALGNRRGMTSLAIETHPKPQAAEKAFSAPAPIAVAAQPLTKPAHEVNRSQSPTAKMDMRKPSVSINPCRVAPGLQDPQSPRSPGRFSAWK